jgi:glycosyltransferase
MMKISIITATFNAADTLLHCLECIKGQTIEVEHILIDGGSTDDTMNIAKAYGSQLAHVVSEPDSGIYDAMNKGIRLATGDIIGILNADDFYADSNTIATVSKVFENPHINSCYGDLVYVDAKNTSRIIRYWKSCTFSANKFKWGWMPPHPTFFVRRSIYEKYGFFNLELGSAADYELMLRFLLEHRVTTAYIPKVLVKMRLGGVSNASIKNRLKANLMDRKSWEINRLQPYPWTLWMKPIRKIPQYFLRPVNTVSKKNEDFRSE